MSGIAHTRADGAMWRCSLYYIIFNQNTVLKRYFQFQSLFTLHHVLSYTSAIINRYHTSFFRQRLEIIKLYFVSQHKAILSKERPSEIQANHRVRLKCEEEEQQDKYSRQNRKGANFTAIVNSRKQIVDQDPTRGLARLGSRAALSFAFKFLKRAWRSGEDADLCSDILYESLDALQVMHQNKIVTLAYKNLKLLPL